MMTKCTLCDRKHYGRGYCNSHYQQERNAGRLPRLEKMSDVERFWPKVKKTETCWLWQAYINQDGYGTFRAGGNMIMAHRYSYQLARKTLEANHELDHLCRTRACVNPSHLESVTHRENSIRARLHTGRKNNLPVGVKPTSSRFQARIKINGKEKFLGSFNTIKEASSAYLEAREKINA